MNLAYTYSRMNKEALEMSLTFKEVASIIQKRYGLNMAEANQNAKEVFDDQKFITESKGALKNEQELNAYFDYLEKLAD